MPEITITIDTATGEAHTVIRGIAGPACAKIAEQIKALAGLPSRDTPTAEYHARAVTRQRNQR
jgi:hypothetical protein